MKRVLYFAFATIVVITGMIMLDAKKNAIKLDYPEIETCIKIDICEPDVEIEETPNIMYRNIDFSKYGTVGHKPKPKEEPKPTYTYSYNYSSYTTPSNFRRNGIMRYNGYLWSWYTERILPGYGLRIPGRYTDSDGFVCDYRGYICVASKWHSKGTVFMSPFGRYACVYDYCPEGSIDVYTNW